jgi:hypothetical protein
MYYRLSKDFRSPAAGKLLALLLKDLEGTDRIAEDRKRLKAIAAEGMDSLCRRIF